MPIVLLIIFRKNKKQIEKILFSFSELRIDNRYGID